VEYDDGPEFPDSTGASMILASPYLDNNVGSNWCESSSPYGDGDLGTPGAENDACGGGEPVCGNTILEGEEQCDDGNVEDGDGCSAVCEIEEDEPFCGDDVLDPGEQCDDGNNDDGDGCSAVCEIEEDEPFCGDDTLDPGEQCDDGNNNDGDGCSAVCEIEGDILWGDIVINEIMQNPNNITDGVGEWFELYNNTVSDIDLDGCIITDSGSDSHIIEGSLIVPANDYVVLTRNGVFDLNGGIIPDYVYSGIALGNDADELILECGGVLIDIVEYDGGPGFPDPDGASMILASPNLDNNIGANWCQSSSPFTFGNDSDLGTPGMPNDSCLICTDNDGDGYSVEGGECGLADCDDSNSNVNPGSDEVCGNQIDDNCDGNTDGSDSACQTVTPPSSPSGGGGGPSMRYDLVISHEGDTQVLTYTATVTWQTNFFSTSRVIYDTVAHSELGSPPNYGYAYSTPEDSNKVTYHEVVITGLSPYTTYYWRAISSASPEIFGEEMSFTTELIPAGEEAPPVDGEDKIEEGNTGEDTGGGEVLGEETDDTGTGAQPAGGVDQEEGQSELGQGEGLFNQDVSGELETGEEEEQEAAGMGAFLAAIGNLVSLENLLWILLIIIAIIIILLLLPKRKKQI